MSNMYEVNTDEVTINWGKKEIILKNGDWTIKVIPMVEILRRTVISMDNLKEEVKKIKEEDATTRSRKNKKG